MVSRCDTATNSPSFRTSRHRDKATAASDALPAIAMFHSTLIETLTGLLLTVAGSCYG